MAEIIVSKQDADQVLRLAYDDASKSIRTTGSAPVGGATEAKQDEQIVILQSIDTATNETSQNTLAGNAALSQFSAKTASALVTVPYDNLSMTYVASGNGVGEIETVIYKLGATIVATLTLAYDSQNRLTSVVRT